VEDAADPPGGDVGERVGHRRVLVVDDHAVVGVGLRAQLGRQPWVERCLTAVDSREALAFARRYEPHVALVDLFIGEESGLELCAALQRVRPGLAVLLMSGGGRVAPAVARSAGAAGFVSKSWAPAMLLEAVRRVAAGRLVFEAGSAPAPAAARLTDRELDVLRQLAAGASNPEAAQALHLSPHTVKQHTSSVYRKLGARNRTDAVRCAQRLGLVY
jgi:DNA-binding NarL/FixJ family response regulator